MAHTHIIHAHAFAFHTARTCVNGPLNPVTRAFPCQDGDGKSGFDDYGTPRSLVAASAPEPASAEEPLVPTDRAALIDAIECVRVCVCLCLFVYVCVWLGV